MKKYIIIAILIGAMVLTACMSRDQSLKSGQSAKSGDEKKLSVVATIFPPYDFARAIAGNKADITMLLPPASESHSYEPTPQDIIKIQDCDVFIYAGGESDEWVREVLDSMDTSEMKIITLVDCVVAVPEEIAEGMQEEEEEEAEADGESDDGEAAEPEYDEHVWTSPGNAELIVRKISDVLCELDPSNAAVYEKNTAGELDKLKGLNKIFEDVVSGAERRTIIFGDRFPFRYFTDAYGLEYYAAFPGCSTETECSAATIAFLIDKIKDEKIPVVFHIELGNEKVANAIAESTGAKVSLLHAAHNISKDDFESGKTYIDIMTANADALKEALN